MEGITQEALQIPAEFRHERFGRALHGELVGRGERGGLYGLRIGLARHTEAGGRRSLLVLYRSRGLTLQRQFPVIRALLRRKVYRFGPRGSMSFQQDMMELAAKLSEDPTANPSVRAAAARLYNQKEPA